MFCLSFDFYFVLFFPFFPFAGNGTLVFVVLMDFIFLVLFSFLFCVVFNSRLAAMLVCLAAIGGGAFWSMIDELSRIEFRDGFTSS